MKRSYFPANSTPIRKRVIRFIGIVIPEDGYTILRISADIEYEMDGVIVLEEWKELYRNIQGDNPDCEHALNRYCQFAKLFAKRGLHEKEENETLVE